MHRNDTKPSQLAQELGGYAPGYEQVLNLLQRAGWRGGPAAFGFTSCIRNSGVTTCVTEIGISLALNGHSVLLIDCNRSGKQIHDYLHVAANPGLPESLRSPDLLDNFVQPTAWDDLHLLSYGKSSRHLAQFRRKFPELMRVATSEFDFVLVDLPIPNRRSAVAAAYKCVDSVLIVVTPGSFPQSSVKVTRKRLNQFEATVGGVILNKSAESS